MLHSIKCEWRRCCLCLLLRDVDEKEKNKVANVFLFLYLLLCDTIAAMVPVLIQSSSHTIIVTVNIVS